MEIKNFILGKLNEQATTMGVLFENINDETSLLETGLVDSTGFIELLVPIEEKFKIEIDFSELDPEEFTTISGLSKHCAKLASIRQS